MNQPAPDWPAAPTPDAPVAPPAPLAPPAPAPLAAVLDSPAIQAMPQFAPPSSPEAALDITAPLMPVMPQQPVDPAYAAPQQPSAPGFAAPEGFGTPDGFPAPQAGLAAAPHADHPTSLAMPTADHAPVANAMPTFADSATRFGAPQQIGGVTAAHPADLADRAVEPAFAAELGDDPTGQWWAPGIGLVLAVAALAWQLVAFYARVQLPVVRTSDQPLTNFDNVISSVPLADSAIGQIVGVLLAAASLAIVLYGSRRGLREPQLQIAIGVIAALSLLCMVALPVLRG